MAIERNESDKVVRNRIFQAAGANLIGQVIHSATQFITIALFVKTWPTGDYADWIKLYTIPIFFSVAATGFGSVAVNELTIEMGRDQSDNPRTLFQTTLVLILFATAFLFAFVILVPINGFKSFFGINQLADDQVRFILLCFVVQFGLQQLLSFAAGCFRSIRCIVIGIMWSNANRLALLCVICSILLLHGSPSTLALGMTITIATSVTLMMWHLSRYESRYRPRLAPPCWHTLRRLAIPSLLFNSLPLGNALRQQGVILLIARLLSNEAVVGFNAMRTLSNAGSQLIMMTNQSVRPEFSIAFGENQIDRMRVIHRRACQVSLLAATLIAVAMLAVGPMIFKIWTSNSVLFDFRAFAILVLVVIFNGFWLTSCGVALATNRHHRLALGYFIAIVTTISAGIPLVNYWGLTGAAVCLLLVDLIMVGIVFPQSLRFTNDRFQDFFASLRTIPKKTDGAKS